MSGVSVAIVNDFEIIVRGLATMLEPHRTRVEIVELDVNAPAGTPVDIALFDSYSQPDLVRRDLTELVGGSVAKSVVVYSWNLQPDLVDAALRNGAAGYLSKALGVEQLIDALERVSRGEVVVSTGPEPAPSHATGDWPGRADGLTARESEIIALITQGLSNQEVADRAYLSINSVKSYIRSAYRKMGVTSRSQAVIWGIDHGFRPARARIRRDDQAR